MKTRKQMCEAIFKKATRGHEQTMLNEVVNSTKITDNYIENLYQKWMVEKKSIKAAQYAYTCLVMKR